MIAFEGVWKVFEARSGDVTTAVADVSLDIERNQFVCLVGPSGCGKSTLLRLAAGLLLPEKGIVEISGERVCEPRPDTGIVFQSPTLLPWATVIENVLFPEDELIKNYLGEPSKKIRKLFDPNHPLMSGVVQLIHAMARDAS